MNNENKDKMAGETMFEYLKRSKRLALENSLSRSKFKAPLNEVGLNVSRSQKTSCEQQLKKQTSRQQTRRNENRNTQLLANQKNEILTRRNSIQSERRSVSRSFIKMISPARTKSSVQQFQKSEKNGPLLKKQLKENHTRKILNEKVDIMRNVIEGQLRAGKSLKQKAHMLFVDLKPFFRHIQNCSDSGIERRVEQIKGRVRALQSIFKEFNVQLNREIIDEFYLQFSQYLNQLDGHTKAQIIENKTNIINNISSAKNEQIEKLIDENSKLKKEIVLLSKRYEKLERQSQEFLEQSNLKTEQKSNKFQQRLKRLQQQLDNLKEKNLKLLQDKQQAIKDKDILEEEIKGLKVQRQKFEEQCLQTITKVKSQQQQYLLNQIIALKKQFNVDLTRMAELYKTKEYDLMKKIDQLGIQIEKLKLIIQDLMKANKQLDQGIIAVKSQNLRIKKQNQCLITDMHRINQQLYQHWLALKDIKILSIRLDSFNKYKKIYDQLLFNEQLFL